MPLLARRAASATERTLVYFRMNMYIRPPMRLSSSPTHQSISGRCWTRADFRDGSMLSKKSFGGNKRNFLKLLMRFVRSDVRDHIASQKNDHGPSYRH